jgi:D-serine dehydratase
VLSRPEPGRIIVGLGKRDASFDIDLPKPVEWVRSGSREVRPLDGNYRTVRLNDHHAYVDVPPECNLQVGDLVCFGISHPCTTFDRWPALYVVDDNRTVVGAVKTYF